MSSSPSLAEKAELSLPMQCRAAGCSLERVADATSSRGPNSDPVHGSQEASAPSVPTRSVPDPGQRDEGGISSNGDGSDKWWKIHLFRGMFNDVRRRAPFYLSDWTDAWDYRVVPATVYMYFANILPALAFSLDMFTNTDSSYGVNEVLLASVLGAVLFSVFSCQPLVIVGVTGPITVFNYTTYDIVRSTGVNYLGFMCWIGIWSLVLHWLLAITNSCNWLRWVTRFPCDVFGFYVAFIYLQKGIQVLERLGDGDGDAFYLSIVAALLVFMAAYLCGVLGTSSLFHHHVRVFLKDYGTPLTLIFFTGFVHIGRMANVSLEVLPTGVAFKPTLNRNWLVDFWSLTVGEIFMALPFALLLTILFWFDHNVSSLIAQGTEFPLRKAPGFHWDLFLLGLTVGVSGLLGLPFPNGLIPQAPFHTESLTVRGTPGRATVTDSDPDTGTKQKSTGGCEGGSGDAPTSRARPIAQPGRVVEQRVSNLAQGLLTLGTMTGPLLTVVGLVPHGVLAGLFFVMGVQALEANGITAKLVSLAKDARLTGEKPEAVGKPHLRRRKVWLFVGIELAGFAATFAITQTVAAVGFPVFIMLLIPVRGLLMPRWLFSPEELEALDEPTASPFIMQNVGGGAYGRGGPRTDRVSASSPSCSSSSSYDAPRGATTRSTSRHGRRFSHRTSQDSARTRDKGGIFASPGSPRKSQEDLLEMGLVTTTATKRGSRASRPSVSDAPSTRDEVVRPRSRRGSKQD